MSDTPTACFYPFTRLPTELRLRIFHLACIVSPAKIIPFQLVKSDLDYLRPLRKPCNNFPHISASSLPIPSLLQACHESRIVALQHYTLGFDSLTGGRMLGMGRGDTDVETFTTCGHEISADHKGHHVYWRRDFDVIFLDESPSLQDSANVWGGRTGIRFQRTNQVAMTYDTLSSLGIGNGIMWESLEILYIIVEKNNNIEQVESVLGPEVKRILKNAGIRMGGGEEVTVKFVPESVKGQGGHWKPAS